MGTSSTKVEPLATTVSFGEDSFCVVLADGREITVPLDRFPRLRNAAPEQRRQWRLIGGGTGIHWEQIDEDISVASLLSVG